MSHKLWVINYDINGLDKPDIPFDEGLLSRRLEDVELPSAISFIGRPEYDPGVGNIGVVDDEGGAWK